MIYFDVCLLSVVRAPRQYEEIDKDFEQDKANAKESNNSRLSQKVAYPSSFLKRRYPGDECLYLIWLIVYKLTYLLRLDITINTNIYSSKLQSKLIHIYAKCTKQLFHKRITFIFSCRIVGFLGGFIDFNSITSLYKLT